MDAPTPPRTPFAELRPNPFARARPSRFPALRMVLKAGSIITGLSVTTAGGCGLVAGGMHGVFVAVALFSSMGVLGMFIATLIAAMMDSGSVVRDGLAGRTLETRLVERGAGQLSAPPPDTDGSLGLVPDPEPSEGQVRRFRWVRLPPRS